MGVGYDVDSIDRIQKYAFDYRNPQGLMIVLAEAGIDTPEEARDILESGWSSAGAYTGLQYSAFWGKHLTLEQWIDYFLRDWGKVKRSLSTIRRG